MEISTTQGLFWALALFGGQAMVLMTVHFGIKAFKTWYMDAIVGPHIDPIKDDVRQIKDEHVRQGQILAKHDSALEKYTTYTLLLLGKVFGGIPNLDVMDELDEPHTQANVPLNKQGESK
jgi:hypothetical protein